MTKKPFAKLTALTGDFILSDFNKEWLYELTFVREISLENFEYRRPSKSPFVSTKNSYIEQCGEIIETIRAGNFNKVVFSRIGKHNLNIKPHEMYNKLCDTYANAFVHLITIDELGTWIGASPESFLDINDDSISTTSLAATKVDSSLNWGPKEVEEQLMVTRFIQNNLSKIGASKIKLSGPYTFDTGAVFHLKTDITCQLDSDKVTGLINQLHPTPATCGLPQDSSLKFIRQIEKHQRDLYCGFIGPTAQGDTKLFVNLRCMQIINNSAYLYLGGGITAASVPELEWVETENKAKTLLKHLD